VTPTVLLVGTLDAKDAPHSGRGEQMVDGAETFPVGPGQAVFTPRAAFHSTASTGWEPLVLLAVYAPAGGEEALKELPDHRKHPPGEAPRLAHR
jgi:oxalate decarboxylase/phosphoglucose isomerase-like protein (cupin superfamily)